MSATTHRTPRLRKQSLFLNDLATPVSSRKGRFSTTGQAAAVSALWRENFANSDLPPPPVFTLEDRSDFSPDSGMLDYPMSPEVKSDPRTPAQGSGKEHSGSPLKGKSEASTSYATSDGLREQQGMLSLSYWSPGKSGSEQQEDKGHSSPVVGVVQTPPPTLTPPREVAAPEIQKTSLPVGPLNEEEWVTVYGFSPGDTNLVLREFEKCGVILKHVLGPRNSNWMHILYQNRSDARKALTKDGMQINGVLIIGVKPVDPIQRHALDERMNNQGFMTMPPSSIDRHTSKTTTRPYYVENGIGTTRQSGVIASQTKSVVSKIMDLMFGV